MSAPVVEIEYNVACLSCGNVWTPLLRTPLWWKAKQRAEKGYLDALHVTAKECGCEKPFANPNAPFRVFGYTSDCRDFNIPCDTFTEAMCEYRNHKFDIVCIAGVSEEVQRRLESFRFR